MERRPCLSNEELAAGRRLTLTQRRALAQQLDRVAREERVRATAERRAVARYKARYRALVANVDAQRN
jgi:hypothetical protein